MPAKLHLVKVEDHEGNGHCQECKREGLRWICILSDGTKVGIECAKHTLGRRPAPKTYNWSSGFVAVAEHAFPGETWVLWHHETGRTAMTRNGHPVQFGGCDKEWTRRGWAA